MPRNSTVRKAEAEQRAPLQAGKARPVRSRRGDTVAAEQPLPKENVRRMKSTGKAKESLEPNRIIPAEERVLKDGHAAELAFMAEPVTVIVHDSTDANAEPLIQVQVDGRSQYFRRNTEQTVKRMFVERLARAKKTSYTQKEGRTDDGARTIENIPHTALRYPFTVLHDPNPRGPAWLKQILAESQ